MLLRGLKLFECGRDSGTSVSTQRNRAFSSSVKEACDFSTCRRPRSFFLGILSNLPTLEAAIIPQPKRISIVWIVPISGSLPNESSV